MSGSQWRERRTRCLGPGDDGGGCSRRAATLALGGSLLVGCAGDGRETIRFTFSKREAIDFMTALVADYNASQDDVRVEIDTSGVDVVSASFVRGNPPDIMLANYNYEVARFVQRCALIDLAGTEAAATIRDDLQPLMEQYGTLRGPDQRPAVLGDGRIGDLQQGDLRRADSRCPRPGASCSRCATRSRRPASRPSTRRSRTTGPSRQGWYDYAVGGSLDVLDFFDGLAEAGTEVGPDSAVSFQQDFAEPMERMSS